MGKHPASLGRREFVYQEVNKHHLQYVQHLKWVMICLFPEPRSAEGSKTPGDEVGVVVVVVVVGETD